jgi:RNase H-like domain found in reverse transcriptase/Reverse transcriptase (RNA-dependent DNA polymerase)
VVLVKKKTGEIRFCIDYRRVNSITKVDAFPLPRIDNLLEKFREAKWFTSVDLASGYWQIAMEEKDKEKTAFVCRYGLYQWNVMPFGLTNAPATFQRMMNEIFMEYLDDFMAVYLDDIIIYSKNWEEHLEHIKKVFEKLREANLKMKLKKCEFAMRNIKFLGHVVGNDGLKPDPDNIKKVKELEPPKNLKDVRAILGLCSYYRRFIKGFSKIAKPINELLQKDTPLEWTKERNTAFEILKKKLIEAPILQFPNFEKEFILCTDASGKGIGAVLAQLNDERKEIVIAYASKTMNKAEQNYPITEQECLAIIWGVQHFHKFLIGRKFTIVTDHSALKTLKTAKVPKGRRARWMMELQQYNFEVKHRSGKSNTNADGLSRLIYKEEEKDEF